MRASSALHSAVDEQALDRRISVLGCKFAIIARQRRRAWQMGFRFLFHQWWSQRIATVLRAGRLRVRVPVEERYFFFSEASGPALGHTQPPVQWAKYKWSFASTPSLCLNGADWENFHFTSKVDECSTPLHQGPVICSWMLTSVTQMVLSRIHSHQVS